MSFESLLCILCSALNVSQTIFRLVFKTFSTLWITLKVRTASLRSKASVFRIQCRYLNFCFSGYALIKHISRTFASKFCTTFDQKVYWILDYIEYISNTKRLQYRRSLFRWSWMSNNSITTRYCLSIIFDCWKRLRFLSNGTFPSLLQQPGYLIFRLFTILYMIVHNMNSKCQFRSKNSIGIKSWTLYTYTQTVACTFGKM